MNDTTAREGKRVTAHASQILRESRSALHWWLRSRCGRCGVVQHLTLETGPNMVGNCPADRPTQEDGEHVTD